MTFIALISHGMPSDTTSEFTPEIFPIVAFKIYFIISKRFRTIKDINRIPKTFLGIDRSQIQILI